MDATTATDFIAANKGAEIIIILTDDSTITGEALSVNSKGVNVKVDGKTRSVALSRVASFDFDVEDDENGIYGQDTDEGDDTDEEIYAALGDGMTTTELAAHLSDALSVTMTPKELRVHLRALGLGVGKGRKYSLTATEYRMVKDLITASAN
ncbi:MAG: hypothetical protein ABW022_11150 [Actinoplanes sp.]